MPQEADLLLTDYTYFVELLTPRRESGTTVEEGMGRFAQRYLHIIESGHGISIPDNPMGRPHYTALEAIDYSSLPLVPERTVININSFHTKDDLDGFLRSASERRIKHLLIIRGDGGPQLPRLEPAAIGTERNVVTSIDILRYISREYSGDFITGAAFNQYKHADFEIDKLNKKIDAGARFVITQPVIGRDPVVDRIIGLGVPVVIEAWMSKNVDLLLRSVRTERDERTRGYDPVKNLHVLRMAYPQSSFYLSMLSFQQNGEPVLAGP